MSDIPGTARFRTTGNLEVTQVPDGFVIYDEPAEKVHYLNPTAAVLYSLCDGKMQVGEMQSFIKEAYDLNEEVSLDTFFEDLEKAGLVCRAE